MCKTYMLAGCLLSFQGVAMQFFQKTRGCPEFPLLSLNQVGVQRPLLCVHPCVCVMSCGFSHAENSLEPKGHCNIQKSTAEKQRKKNKLSASSISLSFCSYQFWDICSLKYQQKRSQEKKILLSLPSFFPFSHLSETFQTFTFIFIFLCALFLHVSHLSSKLP